MGSATIYDKAMDVTYNATHPASRVDRGYDA